MTTAQNVGECDEEEKESFVSSYHHKVSTNASRNYVTPKNRSTQGKSARRLIKGHVLAMFDVSGHML